MSKALDRLLAAAEAYTHSIREYLDEHEWRLDKEFQAATQEVILADLMDLPVARYPSRAELQSVGYETKLDPVAAEAMISSLLQLMDLQESVELQHVYCLLAAMFYTLFALRLAWNKRSDNICLKLQSQIAILTEPDDVQAPCSAIL